MVKIVRKRRTTRPLSSKQAKAVAKIAKRVDMKISETKHFIEGYSNAPSGGILGNIFGYSYGEVLDAIVQGTTSATRVGERIHVKNIYVKGMAKHTGLNSPTLHYYLLRTKNKTPALDDTDSGIFKKNDIGASIPTFLGIVDPNKAQVVGSAVVKFARSSSSTSVQCVPFTFNVKMDKSVKYLSGTGVKSLEGPYHYLWLCYVDEPGNTGTATGVTVDVATVTNFIDN